MPECDIIDDWDDLKWAEGELEGVLDTLRDTLRPNYPYIDQATNQEVLELASQLLKKFLYSIYKPAS